MPSESNASGSVDRVYSGLLAYGLEDVLSLYLLPSPFVPKFIAVRLAIFYLKFEPRRFPDRSKIGA